MTTSSACAPGPSCASEVSARKSYQGTTARENQPVVLVVDDDRSVLNSIGRVLSLEGMEVASAIDPKDALDFTSRRIPDLVLTDLCMAPLTGWDLIAHLRGRHPHLPIFVVTALAPASANLARNQVNAVFRKPMDFDRLVAAVGHQLARSGFARGHSASLR